MALSTLSLSVLDCKMGQAYLLSGCCVDEMEQRRQSCINELLPCSPSDLRKSPGTPLWTIR